MALDLQDALGIFIATLGGAAVGVEREWSGHAAGPRARFAGIRTFTLLGLLAGLSGWLWSTGVHTVAAIVLAGVSLLIVAAYTAASRVEVEGTTEIAAFVVLLAGVIAGLHELRLASGTIALTTLLLIEKSKLHSMVERIDDASLRGVSLCSHGRRDFAPASHRTIWTAGWDSPAVSWRARLRWTRV